MSSQFQNALMLDLCFPRKVKYGVKCVGFCQVLLDMCFGHYKLKRSFHEIMIDGLKFLHQFGSPI